MLGPPYKFLIPLFRKNLKLVFQSPDNFRNTVFYRYLQLLIFFSPHEDEELPCNFQRELQEILLINLRNLETIYFSRKDNKPF